MRFIHDDGGRTAAGYQGLTGDCVCRAVAIATGRPYQEVYDALNMLAKRERRGKRKRGISSAREGVYKATVRRYMESIGWRWVATMQIGSGCTVHLRENELPSGRLVVSLSKHSTAVIDGVIHDTHDPSRDGTRCVYGYYVEDRRHDFAPDPYLYVAAKDAFAARRFFGAPKWWPCEINPDSKVVVLAKPVWRLPAEVSGQPLPITE